MARNKVGSRGSGKKIIRVFCEGESEQAYTEFLKQKFSDVAVINYPKETGLFDRAKDRFDKDPLYREYKDVIDEVWFFFDVETKDIDKVATAKIAKDYPVAVKNAKKTMKRLLDEGMPGLDDTDNRNQWLHRKCLTFSNVYEAVEFLEGLENK